MDKSVQIIKDFVEGVISIEDFFTYFNQNSEDFKELFMGYKSPYINRKYKGNVLTLLQERGNSVTRSFRVFDALHWYLVDKKITAKPTWKYLEDFKKTGDLLPDWLSDDASDYVDEYFLENMPEGMIQAQKKAWLKERIKETFKYEKRPPNWAQGGEWPRMPDGRFMTFRSQKSDGDLEIYTFVNPDTGEEVKIEEYY